MLFVHNLSWNTAELSIIPWSFPSYQGALECVSQTLNHPFRAAFQRGCSWTSDVSILYITLSFISLSCCVMCSVHKDVSSLDSWPYSSSQPGVICSRQHLAILETFLLVETRDALQHPTAHRTGPPAKFRMSVGPRLRNPGLQNQQLKSLFVLIAEAETACLGPLDEWFTYIQLHLLKGICGLKKKCLFRTYCCLWEQSIVWRNTLASFPLTDQADFSGALRAAGGVSPASQENSLPCVTQKRHFPRCLWFTI